MALKVVTNILFQRDKQSHMVNLFGKSKSLIAQHVICTNFFKTKVTHLKAQLNFRFTYVKVLFSKVVNIFEVLPLFVF